MPNDVLAGLDDKQRKAESDLTNKQLLLEAMLLLTKTKNGREVLRQKKLVRGSVLMLLLRLPCGHTECKRRRLHTCTYANACTHSRTYICMHTRAHHTRDLRHLHSTP